MTSYHKKVKIIYKDSGDNMKKNKQLFLTVTLVLVLLLITTGVSVAFFNYVKEGTTENSIKLGTITFKYTENSNLGNGIIIKDAFPISDEEGKIQIGEGKVFDFTIESTLSKSDLEYEVVAEPTEESNLSLDAIKFYLTDITSGTEVEIANSISNNRVKTLNQYSDTLIPNVTGKTIYQETIVKNTKGYLKKFRARMWVTEGLDWSDENYMGKLTAIKINVYANSEEK